MTLKKCSWAECFPSYRTRETERRKINTKTSYS